MEDKNVEVKETVVTPWVVKGKIEYNRLVEQFGTELIDQNLINRMEKVTRKPVHAWIRRGIFFSHRAFDKFLTAYENGEPVFLYTGRGPTSDSMHIGHLIPFMFTKWLQDVFNCPLVIQMSDDEKYYFKQLDFETIYKLGFENAKDIIACGFNPEKTFIFSNRDHRLNIEEFEIFVSTMKKMITTNSVSKIFGFGEESNVGQLDWPFYQSAAAFSKSFPHIFGTRQAHCLVAYAIDQDPYFRMARDLAAKMNLIKPYSIMCQFIPPLTGVEGKMSSSVGTDATIFLTDDEKTIHDKVMKYAFSGGGGNGTIEDHRKYGGNVDVDIACQYMKYFEDDDVKLTDMFEKFRGGILSCSDTKEMLSSKLSELIIKHQKARSTITKEIFDDFYSYKKMELCQLKEIKNMEVDKIIKFLNDLSIPYVIMEHEPIISDKCEEELNIKVNDTLCKAVIIHDHIGNKYMYVSKYDTKIKQKDIAQLLGVKKISYVSKEEVVILTGTNIGTIFGLINSKNKISGVIFNSELNNSTAYSFYAMTNNYTVTLSKNACMTFITKVGCKVNL